MAIPARVTGMQNLQYLRAPITFAVGTAGIVQVGTLPAGSVVVRCYVVNTVAFNFGTNNLIKVGTIAADTTYSGATLSVASLGLTAGVPLAAAAMTPTVDTSVIATSLCTGTAGTAGSGFVVVEYLPVA